MPKPLRFWRSNRFVPQACLWRSWSGTASAAAAAGSLDSRFRGSEETSVGARAGNLHHLGPARHFLPQLPVELLGRIAAGFPPPPTDPLARVGGIGRSED